MEKSRLPKRFLLVVGFLLVVFFFVFSTLNYHLKQNIEAKYAVFDKKLMSFDCVQFKRARPYLDALDHYYLKDLDQLTDSSSEFEKKIHKYFEQGKTDADFKAICQELEVIRVQNQTDTLKHLLKSKANPLALATFFLAPLPSIFISPHRAEIMDSKVVANDKLLKYLSVLRQPSLLRGYLTFSTWLEIYDNPAFISEHGNVLSFPSDKDSSALYDRIRTNLPELGVKSSSSQNFDELMASSSVKCQYIKVEEPIIFTVDMCDFVAEQQLKNSLNLRQKDVLIVKTEHKTTDSYVQISETILIDDVLFYLKAMLIERNGKQRLMLFDSQYQFWTQFDDSNIFSMPRSFARSYFVNYGTHLIYIK